MIDELLKRDRIEVKARFPLGCASFCKGPKFFLPISIVRRFRTRIRFAVFRKCTALFKTPSNMLAG